ALMPTAFDPRPGILVPPLCSHAATVICMCRASASVTITLLRPALQVHRPRTPGMAAPAAPSLTFSPVVLRISAGVINAHASSPGTAVLEGALATLPARASASARG